MSEPLHLHTLPGFWLRCLNTLTHSRLQVLLKEEGAGVAVSEWALIVILSEREGVSVNDLAHLAGMHQAPVSRVIEKLAQKGLVSRVQRPEDRRSVTLELTEEGRVLCQRLQGLGEANTKNNFSCLDESEYEAFMATIQKVLKHKNFDMTGF